MTVIPLSFRTAEGANGQMFLSVLNTTYYLSILGDHLWRECGFVRCPKLSSFSVGLNYTYRVSQEECARLREGVPYVKVYRYNSKHLCPKLNRYGDNGQKKSVVFLRVHVLYLSADNLIHFRPWVWCHMTAIQLKLATELHISGWFVVQVKAALWMVGRLVVRSC